MKDWLALWFSRFKFVRRYVGGMWVKDARDIHWVRFYEGERESFECISKMRGFIAEEYK